MRLAEQPMPQSYHPSDYVWTPLRQNPCWSDDTHLNCCWRKDMSAQNYNATHNDGWVKSTVDDFVGTGYCKHESSLCATICWGSTLVLRFVVWQIKSDAPRSPPPPSTYKQTPKPHVNHEIFMTSSLILTVLDPNLIGSCAQPHPGTSKWCSVVTSVCNVQSLCFTKRFHKQHCLLLFMVLLPGISVYHVPTSKHLPLQQNNNQTETMVKKALI